MAASIANCSNCDHALCGMCATFTENEVLCETCVDIRDTQKFVTTKSTQLEQPERPVIVEPLLTEAAGQGPRKNKSNQQTFQWGITIFASGIIAFQLFVASRNDYVPMDTAEIIQQNAVAPLESCISIFREIGSLLRRNQIPDESLSCDRSGTPNIISREADDIIVSYPHPDFYGYSQIYVSRSNPEPTLVE